MKKQILSEEDNKRIAEAVSKAESKTSGEIVTAIIRESSDYAFHELLAAMFGGFIFYTVSLLSYGSIANFLERTFWSYKESWPALFIGIGTILFMGILYLLANVEGVDRLIVPASTISMKVKRRALLFFSEAGLFDTRDRTGILIFISLREKRVELLADKGINDKVDTGAWGDIVDELVGNIKHGKMVDGLVKAVESCGDRLIEHFPIKPDDENELSDQVHILED
ncbi:TPM domain-containing protein [Spirochaeta isovalerica]|uniref:Putative membrane protein n=1 Tax=Spirochaeta isovalerica TaxID=150 RepID=A0A841R629_9SPIO|nr:TPM domain-containing protein [Spirochaeta isovalerica]MBB6479296.1 putative membrane protein [Spirochaeta isovalerica]